MTPSPEQPEHEDCEHDPGCEHRNQAVVAEHEEARRDRLAELYDIEDEGRMREYALRSPESAAADLSSLLALLSKAEREPQTEDVGHADSLLRSALGRLDPSVLAGPDDVEYAIDRIREARELLAAQPPSEASERSGT